MDTSKMNKKSPTEEESLISGQKNFQKVVEGELKI